MENDWYDLHIKPIVNTVEIDDDQSSDLDPE